MFLVDSYAPDKFDFDLLEQSLINNFPEKKRPAMIFSMSACSPEMVRMKVSDVRTEIFNTVLHTSV